MRRSRASAVPGLLAAVSCPFMLSSLSVSAAAEEIPSRLRACTSEQDDARRLACYDREMAYTPPPATAAAPPAATASTPSQPVAATAPPVAPMPPATEDSFGYRGTIARKEFDRQREAEEAQLVSTVREIATQAHGELVITLENGQVWQQKSPETVVRLKVGDEVTVRRASLGSFMLSPPSGKAIRVTRVK